MSVSVRLANILMHYWGGPQIEIFGGFDPRNCTSHGNVGVTTANKQTKPNCVINSE